MSDINDLTNRLSILEISLDNLKEKVGENTVVIIQVKERFDKMNGAIPHLVEDVKELKDGQKQILDKIENYNKELNDNKINDTKTQTKLKILWGMLAAIGSAVLGFGLKLFFGK